MILLWHRIIDYQEKQYWVCAKKTVLSSWYSISNDNMVLERWLKRKKCICRKRVNNIVKGRQGVLILHRSVCEGQTYKPCIRKSHQSSKLNAWILSAQIQGVKKYIEIYYKSSGLIIIVTFWIKIWYCSHLV